jgi:hypothetical protein
VKGRFPYVKLRRRPDGSIRPRFEPSPRERALGFTATNLRHFEGGWFTEGEVEAFAKARLQEIKLARQMGHRAHVGPSYRAEPRPRSHHQASGFVYFLRVGARIKVGYTASPGSRLSQFRTSTPAIDAFVMVPGDLSDEKRVHRRFNHSRLDGEWFTASRELEELAFLSAIAGRVALSGED